MYIHSSCNMFQLKYIVFHYSKCAETIYTIMFGRKLELCIIHMYTIEQLILLQLSYLNNLFCAARYSCVPNVAC